MGFKAAVLRGFRKWRDYKGRASRSEYWWFALFCALCHFPLRRVFYIAHASSNLAVMVLGLVAVAVELALIVPHLAVMVRRLHDAGHSAGWPLAVLVVAAFWPLAFLQLGVSATVAPIGLLVPVGFMLVLIYFLASPGTPGANRFGPPQGVSAAPAPE